MARNTAEIRSDIAVTRRSIEAHLDALRASTLRRPSLVPLALGGAVLAGLLLSQVPIARIARGIGAGINTLNRAVALAGTAAAVQQYLSRWLATRGERVPLATVDGDGLRPGGESFPVAPPR
jgi:hypothetical protein